MNHAQRKTSKSFINDFDQKYLGGFIGRMIGDKKKSPVESVLTSEERKTARNEVIRQIQLPIPTDYELKRVEIIVLFYTAPEIEVQCAKHLIENTDWPYKLTLFDNRPGTKNMGKILNKLIRESTCDYIVIMDSDCFVPKLNPCWLTRCMETFERYPDCYVVSPAISRISCPQQQADGPRDIGPVKFTDPFPNPCSLHKKEIFGKIGYYDENFLIYGSDVEWSYRLINSPGHSAYLRPDVFVEHIHHYSAKKANREEDGFTKIKSAEREYADNLFRQKTGKQ
ncbi:MAG: glycosyltransferase [Minisyncoccia bacterium]|jgi:hypothetical protein